MSTDKKFPVFTACLEVPPPPSKLKYIALSLSNLAVHPPLHTPQFCDVNNVCGPGTPQSVFRAAL
jgi:hypothetical protein